MTDNLPFYNHLGQITYLPGYPLSFEDWSSLKGESVSNDQQSLLNDVSRIIGKSPTESHVRAQEQNLTLEVGFDDESRVIARKILPKDKADEEHGMQKLHSEARLLHWLANSTQIPVPRVLSPLDDQYRNFIIMSKLPGVMLLNIYGNLDALAKERLVQSFAVVALELFRLDMPQRIGTLVPDVSFGSFNVIPRIAVQSFRATKVFEDIHQYLDFLFEMKKNSPVIGEDDGGHVDELRPYVDAIVTELSSNRSASTLLRCVLVHSDLNEMNILVGKDGKITGVIDWEYQTLEPAVLAADYPPWLSYDACSDPRFANAGETFWLDSPEESERLRELYLKIVKAANHDYWNALVQGAKLRSCVKWLLSYHRDPGCKRMKKWMDATFKDSTSTE